LPWIDVDVEPASQRVASRATNIIKERPALAQTRLLQQGGWPDAHRANLLKSWVPGTADDLVHTRSSGIVFVAAVLGQVGTFLTAVNASTIPLGLNLIERKIRLREHIMVNTTLSSPSDARTDAATAALAPNWWLFLLRGVLGIIFGCLALIFPGPTMLSLILLFSAYMLVDGVAGIISAVRAMRYGDRWGLLILEGLVNVAVGVGAFLWPALTVLAFVLLVASWAIVTGVLMTAAAFRLNLEHGRWWLVLGGVLSLAYGALLFFTPLVGAIVLTWWMGAYALAFGVALVIFSFRLRSRQHRGASPTAVGTAA
jgi:uncharacterized membrane protein HdeD (DUF308 family)